MNTPSDRRFLFYNSVPERAEDHIVDDLEKGPYSDEEWLLAK